MVLNQIDGFAQTEEAAKFLSLIGNRVTEGMRLFSEHKAATPRPRPQQAPSL